ncbi:4'-phosphopantetheinyl transferase psf-1 [Gemmata sp. SH-PL17]|nr:4'-phosphopantetheinyl transferase psf-1 [Gemmata sp. SH-PL17]
MTNAGKMAEVRVLVGTCPAEFDRAPDRNEVRAWTVDLARPPIPADELFQRLTAEEQTRALRYKIAKAREQFSIGRGLLRELLGACLNVAPRTVPLAYLPSGKPVLTEETGLHFNVTHTDGIAVIAVSWHRVGVDVERVRIVENEDGLVRRYFSPAEGAAYRALPERHRRAGFFRGWTTKEAVIKAAGATVACLADFDVELDPERPPCVNAVRDPQLTGPGWVLAEWTAQTDAAIAIAVEGVGALRVEKLHHE